MREGQRRMPGPPRLLSWSLLQTAGDLFPYSQFYARTRAKCDAPCRGKSLMTLMTLILRRISEISVINGEIWGASRPRRHLNIGDRSDRHMIALRPRQSAQISQDKEGSCDDQ